jgi:hypothetical protein
MHQKENVKKIYQKNSKSQENGFFGTNFCFGGLFLKFSFRSKINIKCYTFS